MKNVMTYKGYLARIEFDPRDNIFMGKIIGIVDGITFQGETVKELKADFQAAIDHYLADCAATGRTPLKAASGKLMLRVSPEIHARALFPIGRAILRNRRSRFLGGRLGSLRGP